MHRRFELFVGIDWSGAEDCSGKGIQIAEFCRRQSRPSLLRPVGKSYWTRSAVLDYIRSLDDRPTLIGFDFAFSVPWSGDPGPFLQPDLRLHNVYDLWQLVERICENESNDLFAGPVWLSDQSPFRRYIYHHQSGHKGDLYCRKRLRLTERAAPRPPISIYHMTGAQVGQGSFAGMRLLDALRRDGRGISVWPFNSMAHGTTAIVEVYPSLFYAQAGVRRPRRKDTEAVFSEIMARAFAHFGLGGAAEAFHYSVDQADAVVTAAALSHIASNSDAFVLSGDRADQVNREGWIFGVPLGGCA